MARKRDRIFALSVAALFFISAFGFSFWVIYEAATSNSSNSSTTGSSTAATSCSGSPVASALALPASYTAPSSITALQTTDLTVGTGKAAEVDDCLNVKYVGTLATTGIIFDQNYTAKTSFEFELGVGQVIPGWDQGLVGMRVGGVRRLLIPAALAYGSSSPSSLIPANSNLVFVVDLLSIK